MPYDWIRSVEFEAAVRQRLALWFKEARVIGLPYSFAGELVRLARENQRELAAEVAPGKERPMSVALSSVDIIARSAIGIAHGAGRTYVTSDDIADAVQLRTGMIFPFCR